MTDQRDDMHFRILRLLEKNPQSSQRQIAEHLGISLGAVNYCLRALANKGHLKITNFKASSNKLGYVYALTPEGIAQRARLAVKFIERKLEEYQAIKEEIEQVRAEFSELDKIPPSTPSEPDQSQDKNGHDG